MTALALATSLLGCSTPGTASSARPGSCVAMSVPPAGAGLRDPAAREIARVLVSSAENSSLDWRAQVSYIEYNVERNSDENRGYTAGIVGFTTRTGDLLKLVEGYSRTRPGNPLAAFLPALREVNGGSSADGLGDRFVAAWKEAARDPAFLAAQVAAADAWYVDPAVGRAEADGLGALGQFAYADAAIMHGLGDDARSFGAIRRAALTRAEPPARGGDEAHYLDAYLDARVAAMRAEEGHSDTTRVEDQQRRFLREGNLGLRPPLTWSVYGDQFAIAASGPGCPVR